MDVHAPTHTFCMFYIHAQMVLISLHVTLSPSMPAQHININIYEFCKDLIAFCFRTVDI